MTGCRKDLWNAVLALGVCKEDWVSAVFLDVAMAVSVLGTDCPAESSATEPLIEIVRLVISSCESPIIAERDSRLSDVEGEREQAGVESGSGTGRGMGFRVREELLVTGCCKKPRYVVLAFGVCEENWVGVVSLDAAMAGSAVRTRGRTGSSVAEPSIEIAPTATSSRESRITAGGDSRSLAVEGE